MDANLSIQLKSIGYDLSIDFVYSPNSSADGAYGKNRTCSVNAYVASTTDGSGHVFLQRGDGTQYAYTFMGTSGGITTYPSISQAYSPTTLIYDGTQFIETLATGGQMVYSAQTAATNPTKSELVRAISPRNVPTTYTYGTGVESGVLKTIQNPDGRVLSFAYVKGNTVSLLSTVQDWSNRVWSLTYDVNRNLTQFTTPSGCATQFAVVPSGLGAGLLFSVQDSNGFITQYGYNANNQIATMVAGTAVWTWTYGGFHKGYDGSTMVDPAGGTTQWFLNSSGQFDHISYPAYVVSYVYDSNGMTVKEIRPNGAVMSVSYNPTGLLARTDDILGNPTTFQYSASGDPTTTIDAGGFVWTNLYDAFHNVVATVDPLGRRNTFTYNAYGLMLTAQDGRGLVTTNSWDAHGNLASIQFSDAGVITMAYDVLGRMTARTDQLGRTTTQAWDLAGNMISQTNPLNQTTTYIYNTCLLQAVVTPLGFRTTYGYDRFKNRVTTQNALGFVWTNIYDKMGYPVGTIDPLGNRTTTIYNSAHQKLADVDQLGNYTSYGYDNANRLASVQNPRGYITTTVWNARDAIATQDALGYRTTVAYDALQRPVISTNAMGMQEATVYDGAGQRIASVDPALYRSTTTYDSAGNTLSTQNPNGVFATNVYSANSNRLAVTEDALGGRVTRIYDVTGQSLAIQSQRSYFTSFSYDPVGRLISTIEANGAITTTG